MLTYRKAVRDSMAAALRANFGANMNACAVTYNITPFDIDWSGGSGNFVQTYVDPSNIEESNLTVFPGAALYTQEAEDAGEPRNAGLFCGAVLACLDFYVRERDGVEGSFTEDFFDAVEASAMAAVNGITETYPGQASVINARRAKVNRERLLPLSDGFATRIPMQFQFNVFDRG